jgi:hypothetical protein
MCVVFARTFTVRVLLFITRSPRRYGLSPEQVHFSPQLFEVSPRGPSLAPNAYFQASPHLGRPDKINNFKYKEKDSKVQHTYPFESPISFVNTSISSKHF